MVQPIRCLAALVFSVMLGYGQSKQSEQIVPASKLRPSDPARFFPELARLGDEDLQQLRRALSVRLQRPDLTNFNQRAMLSKLPLNGAFFAAFLEVPSERLVEWTLRTMGEYRGDKSPASGALAKIALDEQREDEQRALAIRVLGTMPMEPALASRLVNHLRGASPDLQVIALEVIGRTKRAEVLPHLAQYLEAPQVMVQYHAFAAIQQIEQATGEATSGVPEHARRLTAELEAEELARSVAADKASPGYLRCQALKRLAGSGADPQAIHRIVECIAHPDDFVSELAGNALDSVPAVGPEGMSIMAQALSHTNDNVRLRVALRLRELGPQNKEVVNGLVAALGRATKEGAAAREVGVCLDVLRGMGTNAAGAGPAIVRLLPERSPVYRGADKHEVDRLRGFMLVTLAEIGVPKEALGAIVAALAASDTGTFEFAGAARAAGALGAEAAETIPLLIERFNERMTFEAIAFDRFDSHSRSTREYTTWQHEALRALRRMGPAAHDAVETVRRFLEQPLPELDNPQLVIRIPSVRAEATQTLAAIEAPDEK